jgi:hypothetical protein
VWVRDSAGSSGSQARNPGVKGRRVRCVCDAVRTQNPHIQCAPIHGDLRVTSDDARTYVWSVPRQ